MTIEKRSATSWRVTEMVNGKRFRVNFDHKPTTREAEAALRELIIKSGEKPNGKLTMKEAATSYVEMKRNVLSPSTIRGYNGYIKNFPKWFLDYKIDDITQVELNKFVNEITPKHSPKTVRNAHGLVSAILGTFRPKLSIHTTLPQKRKNEPYTPTDDDIKKILDELKGDMFYVPIALAAYGLRRGEICALQESDIVGNRVYISRAIAIDENGKKVVKSTKTTDSERYLEIDERLAKIIHEQGYVYNGAPNSIIVKLKATQKKLGLPEFSLHRLRHYFASKSKEVAPTKVVMKMGGWECEKTIDGYSHALEDSLQKAMKDVADAIGNAIF